MSHRLAAALTGLAATLASGLLIATQSSATALTTSRVEPHRSTGSVWLSVAAGGDDRAHYGGSSCGIQLDHSLWCWGLNTYGQLGLGDTVNRQHPTRVGADSDWEHVQLGELYACATRTDHTLWCWGSRGYGELGLGHTRDRWTPTQVGTDTDWADLTTWGYHTCATRIGGTLWCWGSNAIGQLGIGHVKQDEHSPVQVGTDTDWATVDAGYYHTCGTRTDHTLWCWGGNLRGQLGLGHGLGVDTPPARCAPYCRTHPAQVGTRTDWAAVEGGEDHTCATRVDRTLWCWGANEDGQLGLGDREDRDFPVQVGVDTDWANLTLGTWHTCATRTDRTLWCWGANQDGQLGVRDTKSRLTPTQVGTGHWWAEPSGASIHTCSTRINHTLWCWGEKRYLQPHLV